MDFFHTKHVSWFQVPANLGHLIVATCRHNFCRQVSECSFILVDDDVQSCHSWTMIWSGYWRPQGWGRRRDDRSWNSQRFLGLVDLFFFDRTYSRTLMVRSMPFLQLACWTDVYRTFSTKPPLGKHRFRDATWLLGKGGKLEMSQLGPTPIFPRRCTALTDDFAGRSWRKPKAARSARRCGHLDIAHPQFSMWFSKYNTGADPSFLLQILHVNDILKFHHR